MTGNEVKCSLFTKICKKTFKTPFLVTVYLWSISAFFSSPIKKKDGQQAFTVAIQQHHFSNVQINSAADFLP